MSDLFILDNENKTQTTALKSKIVNKSTMDKINDFLIAQQSLKVKEKVIFYRLLSTMINAGITLSKAVGILERQEKKQTVLKKILLTFQLQLKEGKGLSECMGGFPSSFSAAEIGMVESGEKTGKLNTALKDLADQIEKIASINGKLTSALMYPAMIIVVVIGVVMVMMTVVVPRLLDIFSGSDNLPATTKLLISISNFFVGYWWLIIGTIVGSTIGLTLWRKTPAGLFALDDFLLKIPVSGMITKKIILSKFARVLSGMLKSGVSIVESLRITSDAVGNEVYRQRILFLRDDIKKGLKIYESLEGDPLFPEMMISMIQIGEQTARVDEIILKVADFYDEEVDNAIGIINKLLEPFIIVTLAVIVGFIAIAIMQPLMNMADTISNS